MKNPWILLACVFPLLATSCTSTRYVGRWQFHPDGVSLRENGPGLSVETVEAGILAQRLSGELTLLDERGRTYMQCSFQTGLKHGRQQFWHEDGRPYSECMFVDGKEHGADRVWWENGQLGLLAHYTDGVLHGSWQKWDPDGLSACSGIYSNGVRIGRWTFYNHDRIYPAKDSRKGGTEPNK